MANPPTYPSDGRISSLQNYSAVLVGTELLPLVAPGNATAGINYNVTVAQLGVGVLGSGAPGYELTGISGSTPAFIFPPGGVSVTAYGAKVDGVTDDSVAVQAAINSLSTGGSVFFPPGTCIAKNLIVPNGILLVGSGGSQNASIISSNAVNTTVITLSGITCGLVNAQVKGGGIGATTPAVLLSGTEATIRFCNISGGSNPLFCTGSDFFVVDSSFLSGYGSANVFCGAGARGYFLRNKFNQSWGGAPPVGTIFNAWAATTGVGTSTVVSLGGFYIQARNAGTTGGTSPSIPGYGIPFADGSVSWSLRAPTTYYGLQIDAGVGQVNDVQCDHSGAHTAGLAMTNTSAGTPPSQVQVIDGYFGNPIQNGILLASGNAAIVSGCLLNSPVSTTGVLINATASWAGDLAISNNIFWTGVTGIALGTGTYQTIAGNDISGMSSAAIAVSSGVSHFSITSNELGSSTTFGPNGIAVQIATGSSDYYNIVGNNINGATTGIINNGTGTHQFVAGNEGPLSLGSIATINNSTILGNNSGATASPVALTGAQAQSIIMPGFVYSFVQNVNLNQTSTDIATIPTGVLPSGMTRFRVNNVVVSGASGGLTTAVIGLYTGPGQTGQTVATTQSLSITTGADATVNNAENMALLASPTQSFTQAGQPSLFLHQVTPVGTTATANFLVILNPLP